MVKPAELRNIFPRNLAKLVEGEESVSAVCRRLGLNRTQFNRYLSGESAPRPEVLARICDHFDVDARILLEPLENLRGREPEFANALASFLGPRSMEVRTDLFPNGFYRRWRNSITRPGQIAHMLAFVKDEDGARVYRTSARGGVDDPNGGRRRILGVLIGSADSFSMMTKFVDGPTLCHAVFEYQHRSMEGVYPGIALFGRARHPNIRRLVREVLEYVPSDLGTLRRIARHPQFCDIADTPPHVREILSEPIEVLI